MEHSISYFTRIDDVSLPRLLFEVFWSGKKGFFILEPYQRKKRFYLEDEQRTVWEYHLNAKRFDKRLFQYHLWELRHTKLDYRYQDYNCATLTQNLLFLLDPELLSHQQTWVTPLDVAKLARQSDTFATQATFPTLRWRIRMLSEQLTQEHVSQVQEAIWKEDMSQWPISSSEQERFLMLQLAIAYNEFLYHSEEKTEETFNRNHLELLALLDALPTTYQIESDRYKNPVYSQPDSQWSLGVSHASAQSWLTMSVLPTTRSLEDDNHTFFSENQLKLGEVALAVSSEQIRLERLQFYSATSLLPWHPMLGGVSGKFEFGLEQQLNEKLQSNLAGYALGGIGLSHSLHQDILIYGMANLGYGNTLKHHYLYGGPEVGMIIREAYQMKSTFIVTSNYQQAVGTSLNQWLFRQSKWFGNQQALIFEYQASQTRGRHQDRVDLKWKYYF